MTTFGMIVIALIAMAVISLPICIFRIVAEYFEEPTEDDNHLREVMENYNVSNPTPSKF